MQAADCEIEIVADLRVGLGDILVEADGEIALGELAEGFAERMESIGLFFRRLACASASARAASA
ncbi:MAG: hypothetical protein WBE48_10950 [Xanthobacteraceae bacterium]